MKVVKHTTLPNYIMDNCFLVTRSKISSSSLSQNRMLSFLFFFFFASIGCLSSSVYLTQMISDDTIEIITTTFIHFVQVSLFIFVCCLFVLFCSLVCFIIQKDKFYCDCFRCIYHSFITSQHLFQSQGKQQCTTEMVTDRAQALTLDLAVPITTCVQLSPKWTSPREPGTVSHWFTGTKNARRSPRLKKPVVLSFF